MPTHLPAHLCGIDFSGDSNMWNRRCGRSNVWIAEGTQEGERVRLKSLRQVQSFDGDLTPFRSLSAYLSSGIVDYAAIDAPFSLPKDYLQGNAEEAWKAVTELPVEKRHFPSGEALVSLFASDLLPRGKKVLRETESYWKTNGVNVRSTLWNGPRGGAPFTAACMTLLGYHRGSVWPIRDTGGTTLVEAFPAAQLKQWQMEYNGYNGDTTEAILARELIITGLLTKGLCADTHLIDLCRKSADALDAVVCLFSASATAKGITAVQPGEYSRVEGHICVHQ
ncbi:MAG: DUF429 domain-containing protein [Beijerinckiaceae bacterium]